MSDSFATKEEANKVFTRLKQHADNQLCFDCANRNPTWTSIPFGILLCMECSAIHRNLGVHISFVKSSNLDTWQRIQLRNFKFGGNHVAKEFFRKNGGSQYLNNSIEPNAKYTSTVATKYKEKLKQKSLDDAEKHPDQVVLDDTTDDLALLGDSSSNDSNSDFFSNWSKPVASTPSPLGSGNNTPSASTDDLSGTQTKKPVITRSRISRLNQANNPNHTNKVSILSSKGSSRSSRLQAKKINKDEDIDFDELEKKAKAEEQEAKRLGYKPKPEESIKPISKPTNSSLSEDDTSNSGGLSLGGSFREKEKLAPPIKETTQQFQKLGFGMVDGDNKVSNNNTKKYKEVKYTGEVSNKYGTQKAISSDEFFGRGPRFDENAKLEARQKLQAFDGAQSISSSSYFGEDEQQPGRGRSTSSTLGDLENTARDFASKFSGNANQDLEVIKDALEDGANKVGSFLRDFLR